MSAPQKPIQIYLDSDDYSKLSNQKVLSQEPNKKDTLEFLFRCLEENIIEIRYSAINIAEMMHRDDDSKLFAVQRAKLLMDLTRGKTLRPVPFLFVEDAICLGLTKTGKDMTPPFPEYAYAENNDWMDRSRMANFSNRFKSETYRKISEHIKSLPLRRFEKKQLVKKYFKRGQLTKEAIEAIIENQFSGSIPIGNEVIFFEEFISNEMWIGYLTGEITEKEFLDSMLNNMMNVELFISKLCEYNSEIRKVFVSFVLKSGDKIFESIEKVFKITGDIKSEWIQYGFSGEEIESIMKKKYDSPAMKTMEMVRRTVLSNLYNNNKRKIRSKGLKWEDWDRHIINSEVGKIPSIDMLLLVNMQFILDRIKNRGTKLKNSDGADLMHAYYVPYCDIFRADKRTMDLLRKVYRITNMNNTTVLKNPEELPQAIRKMACERGIKIRF